MDTQEIKALDILGMSPEERKAYIDNIDWAGMEERLRKAEQEMVGYEALAAIEIRNIQYQIEAEEAQKAWEENKRWKKRWKQHKKMWMI